MALTLGQCYFQSCINEGNFIMFRGRPMVGNFFAIADAAKYDANIVRNNTGLSPETPIDLPTDFTKAPGQRAIYSFTGSIPQGKQLLSNLGAIEKQILAQ